MWKRRQCGQGPATLWHHAGSQQSARRTFINQPGLRRRPADHLQFSISSPARRPRCCTPEDCRAHAPNSKWAGWPAKHAATVSTPGPSPRDQPEHHERSTVPATRQEAIGRWIPHLFAMGKQINFFMGRLYPHPLTGPSPSFPWEVSRSDVSRLRDPHPLCGPVPHIGQSTLECAVSYTAIRPFV